MLHLRKHNCFAVNQILVQIQFALITLNKVGARKNLHPLYPSCRHATLASLVSHLSPHTEPHTPLRHISTSPPVGVGPPTSLTSVSLHPLTEATSTKISYISNLLLQTTPASSCPIRQERRTPIPMCPHSLNMLSFPLQSTSSKW